jgi:hypothetical protein
MYRFVVYAYMVAKFDSIHTTLHSSIVSQKGQSAIIKKKSHRLFMKRMHAYCSAVGQLQYIYIYIYYISKSH